jgi:ornithine cyclodeaminase
VQARHQVRCLRVVRDFRRIVVWSPARQHVDAYCDELGAEGYDMRAAGSAAEVSAAADVLVSATPAREPLVRPEWLREGLHITAVGSDSPGKQELAAECLPRADLVVVDRLAQCALFGELRHAVDAALMSVSDVHAELGAIVSGRTPGRTNDRQITIADLTGVGFQDTAIASAALQWLSV